MTPADKNFYRFVKFSIIAHVVVLLAFNLRLSLFPDKDIRIPPSVRVDIVGLPEKQKERKLPPKVEKPPKVVKKDIAKAPKKKEKKEKKKVVKKVIKKKQNNAIEKLKRKSKAEEALAKLREEKNTTEAKPEPIKGNKIATGTSLSGLDKIEYNAYRDKVKNQIYENWRLPQWLADSDYKAQALVVIDERGFVIRKEILASSGDEIFDSTVIAAVEKASPFPTPPRDFTHTELIFGFPEN